MPENLKKL